MINNSTSASGMWAVVICSLHQDGDKGREEGGIKIQVLGNWVIQDLILISGDYHGKI